MNAISKHNLDNLETCGTATFREMRENYQ